MPRKKYFLFILIFGFMFLGFVGLSAAQEPTDIVFPVSELGNCANKDACKAYCDNPDNEESCVSFAEKHNLIPKEDIKKAKKMIGKTGPGGCRGEVACRAYCENPDHQDECLEFAERAGFFIEDVKVAAREFLKQGGPGGCRGEKECRAYCDDPANIEQCLEFGKKHGLVSEKDANRARLVAQGGPGGCRNEKECRNYCEKPENQEACLAFAEQEGLMPKEEIERAKNFIKLAQEPGPGGCKGAECRTYCEDPVHQEECFAFAKEHNLVSENEQERYKRGMELKKKMDESGGT